MVLAPSPPCTDRSAILAAGLADFVAQNFAVSPRQPLAYSSLGLYALD